MSRKDITDRQVCKACVDAHQRAVDSLYTELVRGFDLLCERTKQPPKVVLAAMDRAYDRGLLEVGVSLESAWVTDKGKALLSDN